MIPRGKKSKNEVCMLFFLCFWPPLEPFTFQGMCLYSTMALGRFLDSFGKTMPDMRRIIKTIAIVSKT